MKAVVVAVLVVVVVGGLIALSSPAPGPPAATGEEVALADPGATYDPVRAGETLPPGFRQLLPRDGILPVYRPEFVAAVDSGWDDDALVIGLEIDGDARAYPVGFLNRREMVIDSVAGIPVLVTW